jgi:Na+/H+ antiporter NhaD/arsenite permease-like protein
MLPIILSTFIFLVCLLLFILEWIDRTIVALAGAILMIVVGIIFGFFNETSAIRAIDFDTIFLLLAMMILVALLEPTGFFQYLAVRVGILSGGKPVRLFFLFGGVTFVISMFLNSITAIVLIAPVTILICEILSLNIQPFLLAEAFLANLGGTATLVGSPPNILIGSAAKFTFITYLTHSLPIVLIAALGSVAIFLIGYRKDLAHSPQYLKALKSLDPNQALRNPQNAVKVLSVIGLSVVLFLVTDVLRITPALAAFIGAALALILLRPSVSATLKEVQWESLVFFSALFIIIGGMNSAGVFAGVATLIGRMHGLPPFVLGLIFLWAAAILSAVVVNIPLAIAFIPIIQGLAQTGVNITSLWWAVVLGIGLGGNGTLIGSAVNIVVVELSSKTHHPINAKMWNRQGIPFTLISLFIASVLYVLFYSFFSM